MTKHYRASAVLFFLLLSGCGDSGPTGLPAFASAPISPGTTLTIFFEELLDPDAGAGLQILAGGQPVEESPRTICGITANYSSLLIVAPAPSPILSGALNRRIYSVMPLPPGTRLQLVSRNLCTGGPIAVWEALVIRGAQ